MTNDDVVEINQLMALYGHAVDADDQALLPLVFAPEGTFDVRALGAPFVEGLDAIMAFFAAGKQWAPPSHNMTNVHVYEAEGETRARSKWFTLDPANGTTLLGDYDDRLVRTEAGWRIAARRVVVSYPRSAAPGSADPAPGPTAGA